MSKNSLFQPKYLYVKDYQTLRSNKRVNGKIINAYIKLILNRNSKNIRKFPKIYSFTTLFFNHLKKYLSKYLQKHSFHLTLEDYAQKIGNIKS